MSKFLINRFRYHWKTWDTQTREMLASPQKWPLWCQRIVFHTNRLQYNLVKKKDEWMDGKPRQKNMASVAFMITSEMKHKLLRLGYTLDMIKELSPDAAREILNKSISSSHKPEQQPAVAPAEQAQSPSSSVSKRQKDINTTASALVHVATQNRQSKSIQRELDH